MVSKPFFAGVSPGTLLFNRFIHERCLCAFDSSAIYLCRDVVDGYRPVVLKIVATEQYHLSTAGERLYNELEVHQRIQHPNIISCDQFYFDESFAAFSMEYMNGGTLAERLGRGAEFSLIETLDLLLQITVGVEAIHLAGIIHRDLKPENIFLDSDGIAKIGDFGIATIGNSINAGNDEILLGTINYVSPEYIANGYYDRRSDLYSVGLIGYELLTGKIPLYGRSPLERLLCRVKMDPLPPDEIANECPTMLSKFILKSLARKPEERFQSASEMREELVIIYDDVLSRKRKSSTITPELSESVLLSELSEKLRSEKSLSTTILNDDDEGTEIIQ